MDPTLTWKPFDALVAPSLRLDAPGAVMLLLVLFIGWVIARYSARYLEGEPPARLSRYRRALAGTLACVALVALSNNLAVLALAWMGTSLTLHALLTHYPERVPAMMAAHKKFIASRIAEGLLAAGIVLLARSAGTLELDALAAQVRASGLDAEGRAGMALIALAALVKCAQLPLHGWLIQVMEAPTPVSALLHAGVINLSGFVLIRLAEPLAAAPGARMLLVVVAGLSAAIAALVLATRISIKVALAWSTCAQMGFMLLECALGAYGLALLHLVAHSLYKAHAFLGSGDAVMAARQRTLHGADAPVPLGRSLAAALAGLALMSAAAWAWRVSPGQEPALWVLGAIAGLGLAPLLAAQRSARALALGAAAGFAVALAYFGLHRGFAALVPATPLHAPSPALAAVALALFAALFLLQAALRAAPTGALAQRLHPWFFGGLFVDELFTRLTFRVWPMRKPAAALATQGATQ